MGNISFGPRGKSEEWEGALRGLVHAQSIASQLTQSQARLCNCIGPQPGEMQCPCALAAEMQKGNAMIREGVTIHGKKYRLVPE